MVNPDLSKDALMTSFTLTAAAPEENLRRLLVIRGLFLLMILTALAYCNWYLHAQLPYQAILSVVSLLTLISVCTLLQVRVTGHTSELAFCGQLLIDIVGLTLLLFFSGGADNPFVSYYLVPLCIAAATLPGRLTWPLLLTSLCLYTGLIFFNIPLPGIAPAHGHEAHTGAGGVSIHTLGMWLNFVVSACLISYFVIAMAISLRRQDAMLAQLKEDKLRDEQLMAVATLAAGTAHELGTPLTTIKTLLHEMQAEYTQPLSLKDDLDLLQTQISHCTDTLHQLNRQASELKEGQIAAQSVRQLCAKVIDHWLLLRPEVEANIHIEPGSPEILVRWQPTITQSLSNLLNNAADAEPVGIDVHIRWSEHQLTLRIHDKGPGIDPNIAQNLGQAFVTDKGQGRGLGLFLTRAAVERYGGVVSLARHPHIGTLTTLTLPLHPTETTS